MVAEKKTSKSKADASESLKEKKPKDPAFLAMDKEIPALAEKVISAFADHCKKIASSANVTDARTVVSLENYGYRRLIGEIIWKMRLPIRFERRTTSS